MTSANQSISAITLEIRVRGTVQGVGFRPMVWRLAAEYGLVGTVRNDNSGVLIHASATPSQLSEFISAIRANAPPLSRIDAIKSQTITAPEIADDFRIIHSTGGTTQTQVTPDAATCDACLSDIADPANRRHGYAFANCTHCGPRFSIVNSVPYDRASTTMADFPMCRACKQEYENPNDRRFHAQPIACPNCGPKVWLDDLTDSVKPCIASDLPDILNATSKRLKGGKIVAIRGLGGFHLACDATNSQVVERLRSLKLRYAKPFALMARDAAVVQRYCQLNDAELTALQSPAAPIIVLETRSRETLPAAIAPGIKSLGFMLPYTPLHHLLMQNFDTPLVMTSGNMSDEPQVTTNSDARTRLLSIADFALLHDRDIANRIDDSVVRFLGGKISVLRRARGYAPASIPLPHGFAAAPDILAYGGELKSTFCLVKNGAAILSQHQGDLENVATLDDFQKNLSLYQALYDHEPVLLACDIHPEYLSTKLATDISETDAIPVEHIQHHHAHVASCMAENGVALSDAPVLGIALDGLGMGENGALWGGEFLLADYRRFRRLATFKPVPMPGGAQAIREPWRNTYAHLVSAIGWPEFTEKYSHLDLFKFLDTRPLATLDQMQTKGINSPNASSCGRLFDAVAAAVGICRERAVYEGQGAIELEAIASDALAEGAGYPFEIIQAKANRPAIIDPAPMWRALLDDLHAKTPTGSISARFHCGISGVIAEMALQLVTDQAKNNIKISTIALTGGCFQNKLLLEIVSARLSESDLNIITHSRVPANDGGLSLGQAAIAAARHLHETDHQGRE